MKFQHAPGLPGYGTVGVDGSDGLLGISTYFCEYDATTTVQVTPKLPVIINYKKVLMFLLLMEEFIKLEICLLTQTEKHMKLIYH